MDTSIKHARQVSPPFVHFSPFYFYGVIMIIGFYSFPECKDNSLQSGTFIFSISLASSSSCTAQNLCIVSLSFSQIK